MPSISSNIPEDSRAMPQDISALRDKYIGDGRTVAEHLAREGNVSAVWLSGPFELPRIAPSSDLHMAVLLEKCDHSFYRHVLPKYSPVGRRLEIAFFSLRAFERSIEKGCIDWPSVFDVHKLRNIAILFDRNKALARILERLESFKPSMIFVGAQIRSIASEIEAARHLLENGLFEDSLLRARLATWRAAELWIVAARKTTFSKASHVYPNLRSHMQGIALRPFEEVQGIDKIEVKVAEEIAAKARSLVEDIFKRQLP